MSFRTRITFFLAVFSLAAFTACGGSPPDGCPECVTQEAEQRCGPDSGCDPEDPWNPYPTGPVKFHMQMWNATSGFRKCMYTYSYSTSTGTVSGAVVAAEVLAPNEKRTSYIYVPKGAVVSTTSGCWHPDSTDVERAVYSTSRTISSEQTCMSAYSFVSTGPTVEYPCWFGAP